MKTFIKTNIILIVKIIMTIYILYSLKYLYWLKHIESEFYMNITFIFIIAAVFLLINFALNESIKGINKKLYFLSCIVGIFLAFAAVLGAYYSSGTVGLDNAEILDFTFVQFKQSLIYIPALWFLFFCTALFIFIKIPQIYNDYINKYNNYTETPALFNKMYKIWLFIFICWLPYFILLYPGYVFWDAAWQIEQAVSNNFNAHHPILTTLYMYFIGFYYKISNNIILSIALYVLLFQMLPLSFVYAYMIDKLNKIYDINKIVFIFLILFVAFYPVNPIVSIIVEKGILFLIFFILFLTKIIEIVENRKLLKEKKYIIELIIIGAVLCLTRNNMVYGLILILPVILFFIKQYRKKIFLLFIGILVTFIILNTVIIKLTDAKNGEFRNIMSIPIQQLVRVYKYHKDTLNGEELRFIENIVIDKERLNYYNPKWSDPVKDYSVSQYFKNKDFFIEYIILGIKYPVTYLNSFLIMSSNLWYPFDNSLWLEGIFIVTRDIQLLNLKYDDYFKHKNKYLKDYLNNTQLRVKQNNSMASFIIVNQSFLFYFFMFTFIYFIYRKLYKYCFILLIPLGYIATLFLGPIMYFRYTYFLAALIPILIMMLTNRNNNMVSLNNEK